MQKKLIIFSEPLGKKLWLKNQSENKTFSNATFKNGWMPLSSVKASYPFFIHRHFNIRPDLSKRFLPYFDYIQLDKTYKDQKMMTLQTIKRQLIHASILKEETRLDGQVLQLDQAYVPQFIHVDKNESLIKASRNPIDIYKTLNKEEQVYGIFEKIVALLESGIDINQIKVLNSDNEDDFQLQKLCQDAQIPLWFNKSRSIKIYPIYQKIRETLTKEGIEAAKEMILSLKNQSHLQMPLIHLFNAYQSSMIESNLPVFLAQLDQVSIKSKRIKNAVEVMSIDQVSDLDHHYILMNYIDEVFPKKAIDNDYLSNQQKRLIDYPTSDDVNSYRLNYSQNLLNGLDHLSLFYPQKLVDETRLSMCHLSRPINHIDYVYEVKNVSYLPGFDRLRFGQSTYIYENYQMMSDDYPRLLSTYKDMPDFNHQFKGIEKNDLDELLNCRFTLTGTKIETLNLCPFKYFLTYLLNLESVEPNHYIYFGNQIHHALEQLVKNPQYDYQDMVYKSEDFPKDIAYKKPIYQKILIDNIKQIYDIVKDFQDHSSYKSIYTEKYIERKIDPNDRFIIKGFIDKVMVDKEKGYYAIIDYKYSEKTFFIKDFERGLKLQLPFYLYLFDEEEKLLPSGVFFRQTGLNKEKSNQAMDMRMNGLFLDDPQQMQRLDPNARHIKGLAYKKDGDLKKNASKLSLDEFKDIHKFMGQMIIKAAGHIESGDFKIKPILTIQKSNASISCQYCPFGHICYSKNKHIKEAK